MPENITTKPQEQKTNWPERTRAALQVTLIAGVAILIYSLVMFFRNGSFIEYPFGDGHGTKNIFGVVYIAFLVELFFAVPVFLASLFILGFSVSRRWLSRSKYVLMGGVVIWAIIFSMIAKP